MFYLNVSSRQFLVILSNKDVIIKEMKHDSQIHSVDKHRRPNPDMHGLCLTGQKLFSVTSQFFSSTTTLDLS